MSLPAILVGAALLIASIPFLARPLLNQKKIKPDKPHKNSSGSQNSYEQTLLALRDLDFDHQLGMVADDDYQQIRSQMVAEAAQAIDGSENEVKDLEHFIETAVRDRRRSIDIDRAQCEYCGAILDTGDKFCTVCGSKAASSCPHCKKNINHNDKFCTSCGLELGTSIGATI